MMTCSELSLFTKYISSDKRLYILLDKKILPKQYELMISPNIWFIRTDLELPNLILNEGTIIHVPFGLKQHNENMFNDLSKYLKKLIAHYVKQDMGFDYDYTEDNSSICIEHRDMSSLMNNKNFAIGDNVEHKNVVRKTFSNKLNQMYRKLEVNHINPLDVVIDSRLNPVIAFPNGFIELNVNFTFDLQSLYYLNVYPEITHSDAFDHSYYYLDMRPVIVKEKEEISKTFKVDLVKKHDEKYKDMLMIDYMKTTNPKSLTLQQKFLFQFDDYQLSDFTFVKLMSDDKIEKLKGDVEIPNNVIFYQSQEGNIAVVNEINDVLLRIKDIKYFLQQK
jgi:hypothetical protein